jgi:hypothetical protein
MKRVDSAPNLVIATLWADALTSAGMPAEVFSRYLSSIAGEIPPDQCDPTIWVLDDADLPRARQLLRELRAPVRGSGWICPGCGERHGPQFAQCWNCGRARPDPGPV